MRLAILPFPKVRAQSVTLGNRNYAEPRAEARQRLAVALSAMAVRDRAKAVSDEQFGILRNARIEDGDGAPVGQNSVQSFTPEEIERRVHQLTTNPALFDEVMALLVHGQTGTGEPPSALPGTTSEAD